MFLYLTVSCGGPERPMGERPSVGAETTVDKLSSEEIKEPVESKAESLLTSANRPDAAPLLLQAFQNSCSGTRVWTDAALSHNNAMISMLKSLKETDACKAHISTIAEIGTASAEIEALLDDKKFNKYRLAEEKIQELSLTITSVTDPALKTQLADLIVQTQIDAALERAEDRISREASDRERYARSTKALAAQMQLMLKDTSGLADCLQQSPSSAIQLANNFMAMGGSFVSPVLGAATSVVGQLFNLGIEFFRTRVSRKTLWNLYSAQLPVALSCGLEAMTDLHCQASDSYKLIEFQVNQTQNEEPSGSQSDEDKRREEEKKKIWRGLDLLIHRMPVLNTWLLNVKNGNEPSDPTQAARQNDAWGKIQSMERVYRSIVALLNQSLRRIEGASDDSSKQSELTKQLIVRVGEGLKKPGRYGGGGDYGNSPISDLSSSEFDFACWLVKGVLATGASCNKPESTAGIDFGEWVRLNLVPEAMKTPRKMQENWRGIYLKALSVVESEFYDVIVTDPASLIAGAGKANPGEVSPYRALELVQEFLLAYRDESERNDIEKRLLRDTLGIIGKALCILNPETEGDCGVEGAVLSESSAYEISKIKILFNLFHLGDGIQFFNERIKSFIQWDLNERLEKGQFPDDVDDILRSVNKSLSDRIIASGVSDFDSIMKDLNNSRQITEYNIDAFLNYFSKVIVKSVEKLRDNGKARREKSSGTDRPNGQVLGKLCALLLISNVEDPGRKIERVCRKTSFMSMYKSIKRPTRNMVLKYDDLKKIVARQDYKTRVCAYHRFKRSAKLAEIVRRSEVNERDGSFGIASYRNLFTPSANKKWSIEWTNHIVANGDEF